MVKSDRFRRIVQSLIALLTVGVLVVSPFTGVAQATTDTAAPPQAAPAQSAFSQEDNEGQAAPYAFSLPVQPAPLAQPQPPARTIQLKSRTFTPAPADAAAARALAQPGRERVHVLLQLDYIPREAARLALAQSGIELLAYVPDHAWIASVPAADPAAALAMPGVTWLGEFTVQDKLAPAIARGEWASFHLAPDGTAAVYVVLHADESLERGRELVIANGGRVVNEVVGLKTLIVEMPATRIADLAADDAVQWVEPAQPALGEANDEIRALIGVNTVQAAPYNLTGTGVDILIYDSGVLSVTHPDFTGRQTIGAGDVGSTISDHASHVAGTAAGSGSLSASNGGTALQWRGMAPGADVISYQYDWSGVGMLFYNNPGDIEADWAAAQNSYGADVGNASLGSNIYANYPASCTLYGNYGVTEALMDQIVRGSNAVVGIGDKYITTWAAGNERPAPGGCGLGSGYGTISPPGGAKNPIHVGASDKAGAMSTFSSWGPTDDGRIKPTIVATGVSIQSTIPNRFTNTIARNCNGTGDDYCYPYDTMSGTSMAAPAVAGSIALMLQRYRSEYSTSGNFWPSTAKAILMQTARDRGNLGADYQWGFGLVDIHAAIDLIDQRGFVQANVASGETDLYVFPVPEGTPTATVSLAWDDFPATFNANPVLINNLTLELVSPSGTLWRPWILNPASPATAATRGIDTRNNQEQVQVFNPEPGTWRVRVIGASVPQGPQDYSLACLGCRTVSVGACQATANTMAAFRVADSISDIQQPLAYLTSSETGETIAQPIAGPDAQPLSAGDRWQQGLEAQSGASAIVAVAPEVLREFDAVRNAGPEAVIAYYEQADETVRELIAGEVEEAHRALLPAQPAAGVLAPPAPMAPRVGVNGACAYNTIQDAINAATNGSTVRVANGYYAENIDISGKVITIEGGYNATCTTPSASQSRVDAAATGSVVDVTGGSVVRLKNMILGWGSSIGAGLDLLGSSQVTLDNTDIMDNNGSSGGGMYIGSGSVVTLTNGSVIQQNTGISGGGAIVYGMLRGLDTLSDITGNCSTGDGGGVFMSGGTLYLNNSDVHANSAMGTTGRGGGIFASNGAIITLTTSSFIGESAPCCNTAYNGAGIYADNSRIFSLGGNATILQNQAANNGGGLYLTNGSLFNAVSGTNVGYDFLPGNSNTAILGAGMYVLSSTVEFSGRIINNVASNSGGGLYATESWIKLADTTVGGTGINLPNRAIDFNGAGLYLFSNTHARITNTVISSNTLSNTSTGYGGGVYVRAGSYLTATDSRIERHVAPSGFDGRGAGMYIYDAVVTLNNSVVQSNTAANLGGGARLFGASLLNMNSGSVLANNVAGNANGGAVAATNTARVVINNSTLRNNVASTNGGALSMDSTSVVTISNNSALHNNVAGTLGGALHLSSSARANVSGSTLQANTAGTLGGAVVVTNTAFAIINTSTLRNNTAGADGGGIFSANRLSMNRVQLHRNSAARGGAIYQQGATALGWLSNTLIYSNTSSAAFGAGIRVAGGAFTLTHSTIANNTGGAGFSPGAVQSYIRNSVIYGNSTIATGVPTAVTCSIDQGGIYGTSVNPQYVSPGAGENYRLRPSSPAVDLCNSVGVTNDLDGVARPRGPKFDAGAYETQRKTAFLPIILR